MQNSSEPPRQGSHNEKQSWKVTATGLLRQAKNPDAHVIPRPIKSERLGWDLSFPSDSSGQLRLRNTEPGRAGVCSYVQMLFLCF